MLKALNDYVVIQKEEVENITSSGIYVDKKDHNVGVVKDCKKQKELIGKRVLYKEYAGTAVTDDDIDYIILKLEEVLAVVED